VRRADLPDILRAEMDKGLPYPASDYVRILEALQLIDDEPDAMNKFMALYQSQVLAFYDPLVHTYYSLDVPPAAYSGSAADGLDRAIVIHELTHALQDQRFDIGRRSTAVQRDWDAALAYQSVLEGEASLVMLGYLVGQAGKSIEDLVGTDILVDALSGAAAADKSVPAGTPEYFTKSLEFPYLDGLRFVIAAFRRGGWPAVDELFIHPPLSTHEILHPLEYAARVKLGGGASVLPSLTWSDRSILSIEHLGEWHWGFLVGPEHARGWRADSVTIRQDPRFCDLAVHADTTWSTPARAADFSIAYAAFLRSRGLEPFVTLDATRVQVDYAVPPSSAAASH
jgi:hypothetical protein